MVEKFMFNNKGKGIGQREVRPVWNNARRVNHQNFSKLTHPNLKRNFVPTTVATKSRKVLVNAAKQNLAASTSTARPKQKLILFSRKINNAKGKNVITAGPKAIVNVAEGKKENAVKSSACWIWRPKGNPQYTLQDQWIFNSGCSRHMTGNKSFLIEYQKIDGGFVAFEGSPKGGIKREFSVARTPQQNKVAEKKNRTLIETARTMLIDSLLPTTFWAEAVNTACYVQNRVLVTKPHNKTPCELLIGRLPNLKFVRHFVCPVTILNTLEHLGKFDGSGPEWLFDIDYLTKSMNYDPVSVGNQSNGDADVNAGDQPGDVNNGDQPGDVNAGDIQGDVDEISRNDNVCQGDKIRIDCSTRVINAASTNINIASNIIAAGSLNINNVDYILTNMPTLEDTGIFDGAFDDRDLGAEADTNNLDSFIVFSHIPTTRVHKDHPKEQIIRDRNLNTQTRRMINFFEETAMVSFINRQRRINHKDLQNCLFACFLSQMEPKKVIMALKDPSWIKSMQEELF
nr:hypothetical protein [Tanacetum cinerariifolium]